MCPRIDFTCSYQSTGGHFEKRAVMDEPLQKYLGSKPKMVRNDVYLPQKKIGAFVRPVLIHLKLVLSRPTILYVIDTNIYSSCVPFYVLQQQYPALLMSNRIYSMSKCVFW